MPEINVTERIKKLCAACSWTYYRLAKESGITYSTLSTMLNKETIPSIPTLEKICNGFGITLSQFFANDENTALLTALEKNHLERWVRLTPENQDCAEKFLCFLLEQQAREK